jgi:hypothetical protein
MEYLINSEHYFFRRKFYSEISRFYFFRPEYTSSDEIIEFSWILSVAHILIIMNECNWIKGNCRRESYSGFMK